MYYHPSFPDWGARITTVRSHTTLSRLQCPEYPAEQRAGLSKGLSERVWRGKETEEATAEARHPLAKAAVQQPGQ